MTDKGVRIVSDGHLPTTLPPRFINVGELRRIMSGLPDDAAVLIESSEDEEFGPLTYKLEYATAKRVLASEIKYQNFDIQYFDNEPEGSLSALVLSHDTEPQTIALEHISPSQTIARPMRKLQSS